MSLSLNRALTWSALLLAWAMLVAHLQLFWSCSPQYQYGWMVIPLGLRLFYLRWTSLPERVPDEGRGATAAAILCMLLLAPLWVVREATPDWSVPSYGLTAAVTGYTLAMLALMGGWRLARQVAFPVLFIFCAVKLPLRPESWMIQSLSRFAAGASAEVLHLLCLPAIASGNTVLLPSGTIGINEECSGIQSFQSLLMVALFLGEERRMRAPARLLLAAFGAALSLSFNTLRILLLALISLHGGLSVMEKWHDRAGWTVLLASLGFLLLAANQLGKPFAALPGGKTGRQLRKIPGWLAASLAVWIILVFAGTEWWYRSHDLPGSVAKHLEIHWPRQNPSFSPVAIPDRVRDITLCTDAYSGRWKERNGAEWTLSSLVYGAGKATTQEGRMHSPDICYPAAGMPLKRSYPSATLAVSGGEMGFECREFECIDGSVFVFYCLYEEANRDQTASFLQNYTAWSRIQRAVRGERNRGQQSVEITIMDGGGYEAALQSLRENLPGLLAIK